MMNAYRTTFGLMLILLAAGVSTRAAEESICASVSVEVEQDATIERQAFDARLRIANGYDHMDLTHLTVDIKITDSDGEYVPYTTQASGEGLFFVRLLRTDGIQGGVDGEGTVSGGSTGEAHWMIIPAPGAGGDGYNGERYEIGGRLSYLIGGKTYAVELLADTILVRPMPELEMHYFITEQVVGDDAFTEKVEAPVPFAFGLQARNVGHGPAPHVRIDSVEPEIVDNEQGLQIGFELLTTEVNGKLLDHAAGRYELGTIEPDRASTVISMMQCSLAGEFTGIEAEVTHADELGGQTTSLIRDTYEHLLLGLVQVRMPGRDDIRDFLTYGETADEILVYESEGTVFSVTNITSEVEIRILPPEPDSDLRLVDFTVPPLLEPFYASKELSWMKDYDLISGVRLGDHAPVPEGNLWIRRTRDNGFTPWRLYLSLFDSSLGGTYRVTFREKPKPIDTYPQLQYIGKKVVTEGEDLGFLVDASDEDGDAMDLLAYGLPDGATFGELDELEGEAQLQMVFDMFPQYEALFEIMAYFESLNSDGASTEQGVFHWETEVGDYGVYPVKIEVTDGEKSTWKLAKIYVGHPGEPLNAEGIPESLADWRVQISDIKAYDGSNVSTVRWEAVEGVPYDVYYSDDPVSTNMAWNKLATHYADGSEEDTQDTGLAEELRSRFYQVVLAGDEVDSDNIWGVIRTPVEAARIKMMSVPVRMDRRLDGEFGAQLAEQLEGSNDGIGGTGAELYVMSEQGSWDMYYLDAAGTWRTSSGLTTTNQLPGGAGFFLVNGGAEDVALTLRGQVGNDGSGTRTLREGWNLIGLSEGRTVSVNDIAGFEQARGGASEDAADMLIYLGEDGQWHRLMKVDGWGAPYDGKWFDLSTFDLADPAFRPADAYYFYRQSGAGDFDITY